MSFSTSVDLALAAILSNTNTGNVGDNLSAVRDHFTLNFGARASSNRAVLALAGTIYGDMKNVLNMYDSAEREGVNDPNRLILATAAYKADLPLISRIGSEFVYTGDTGFRVPITVPLILSK